MFQTKAQQLIKRRWSLLKTDRNQGREESPWAADSEKPRFGAVGIA
jgi:hypothetical protein